MSGPEIVTFGCRLNIAESEVIRRHATAAGLDDAVIVHTCAVTAEAERQARQAIRKARRERPHARLVVTGCSVQIDPAAYGTMPEIDAVIGNHDKLRPESWRTIAAGEERARVADIMTVRETAPHLTSAFDGRSRAFLQIQNGCDHRCTFCVIPYGRGPSRSAPVEQVVGEARALVAGGHKEIVLTGVDLTSWGRDLLDQPPLGALVAALLREVPDLPRLRLSSLDPAEIDPLLFALITCEPRLMPHLHLSVQAGHDLVLKRMKRRHLRSDVIALAERLRDARADIVLGADLIAGFPTEDEAMFEATLALVEEAGLTFLHVFPFSPREGTPAARMPQVPKAVRKERAARLREAGERALDHFLKNEVGRTRAVLMEQGGRGHTPHFALARVDAPAGGVVDVHLTGVADGMLEGEAVT